MAQTLFTTQTPANGDAADGTDSYTMGTYFTPAVDGTVTDIRWYFPASGQPADEAVKANLFRTSDSAKLGGADASFASPGTPSAWNQVALNTPVAVTGGVEYCAAIRTPLRYVASTGSSTPVSPWPFTEGDLSAPTNAGRFTSGVSGNVDFPSGSFNSGCYFIDLVFEAGVAPSEGTVNVGLDFAVAATGARASVGAAALGLDFAVAAVGSSPNGGAVDVGLGFAVAATGARISVSDVDLGLNLAVAATGGRASAGTVALGISFAVDAVGSNGEIGEHVTPWPWAPRAIRPFTEEDAVCGT